MEIKYYKKIIIEKIEDGSHVDEVYELIDNYYTSDITSRNISKPLITHAKGRIPVETANDIVKRHLSNNDFVVMYFNKANTIAFTNILGVKANG